jgi:hypothetical protein
MRNQIALMVLLCCDIVRPVFAEEPSVTPYRPTVSNPATLSQPGWLEVESGWLDSVAPDNSTRGSLPYTLKVAFTENFGVMLGGEAYVDQTDPMGARQTGVGDTFLLLKNKWQAGEDTDSAFGLEYGFKVPTAKNNLGSGKTDYLVNGIYSTELSGNTIDLNLNMIELGYVQPGQARQQFGWAAAWSSQIDSTWGIAAELSGYIDRGTAPGNQFLAAVNYAMSRRVVWDTGFATRISQAGPKWSLFAGVSILVGRI